MRKILLMAIILLFVVGCARVEEKVVDKDAKLETATFAGGCFWCMESLFQETDGVAEAVSGYTSGKADEATYKKVSSGKTGHYEAVKVVFDSNKVSYKELVDLFWRNIDPTDAEGQFFDKGPQYKTAVFYHNNSQKKIAETSKKELEDSGVYDKPIVTEILPAEEFYEAEDYHQDYYKKSLLGYKAYVMASGRKKFLKEAWKDGDELKEKLTKMQYAVTQKNSTEPPFLNKYWNTKEDGIYVDIVSGEALFSSIDKFSSGTGWPSFTKPLAPENIIEREDKFFFGNRTEVRSKEGNSHIGHIFNDGPKPSGIRYCMNSAALRFVPKEDLKKEGYEKYLDLFES